MDDPTADGTEGLRATAASLALRCTVGLVGLVVLLLSSHVLLEGALGSRDADALTIELAGEQRMLVQRVASSARAAAIDPGDRVARDQLSAAIGELRRGHEQLFHGQDGLVTREPSPELTRLLDGRSGLDAAADDFLANATVLADPAAPADRREYALARVTVAADGALDEPLAAVMRLEPDRVDAGHARNLLLLRVLNTLGLLGAVVLVLGVFRPLVLRLRGAADSLARSHRDEARRQQWHREFASIANHELRTPVTVLAGMARTLREHDEMLTPELRRDIVDRIDRQGSVMSELLDELSTVAGLAGSSVDVDDVDLDSLLVEVRGGRDGVVVETRGIMVLTDRGRLRLLLRELVDNGLQHGSAPVMVSAVADSADLLVEVRDHGLGIEEDEVRRLLEVFAVGRHIDNHTGGDGRGLGLSMVASIVQECDGTLTYRREPLGGAWCVRLPGIVTVSSIDADGRMVPVA